MAIPDLSPPVKESLPSELQRKIPAPTEKWTDEYAYKIVASDWAFAESYRVNAHDWRYRNADELYLAWVGQNYWDGTRVPRSSLGIYLVFGQVEALLPKLVRNVTNVDGYHFYNERPSADSEEDDLIVTAYRTMIGKQLDETNFREQVRRALKSMAVYGNGVLEVGVENYQEEYINFDKRQVPKTIRTILHPTAGLMQVPDQVEEKFSRKITVETKLRPYVRYVSMKDLFVDPNLESSILQEAGYVMKRRYMRAGQVKELARDKDFRIPSDAYLTQLSKTKSTANADVSKLAAELYRYNMWNPSQDYTSDPAQKRIAVIEYTTPDRKVWWLQGGQGESESIIYNKPNKYGMINLFSVPYADVMDRWHGLSVSDVTEGDQRLQGALINGRIDELALGLHPPRLKRRGVTVPWYQLKRAPGRITEVENPESDIVESEIRNITQAAYVEVAASDVRAQKITGLTDLAALGTPSSGGNSANRTAAGVNTQAGATQDRTGYLVETIEDILIEPVVQAVIHLDRKFMDLKTVSNWLQMDPRFQKLDPVKVMNARIVVECRASTKMAGRMQLLQIWPQLFQTLANPEFVQMLASVNGMTLNPKAIAKSLTDSINYAPPEPWFIDLKPEQKQQMQQAAGQGKAEAMAKMQIAQQKNESDQMKTDKQQRAKLLETLIKEFFESHRHYSELDDKHSQVVLEQALQAEQAAQAGSDSDGGAGGDSSAGA